MHTHASSYLFDIRKELVQTCLINFVPANFLTNKKETRNKIFLIFIVFWEQKATFWEKLSGLNQKLTYNEGKKPCSPVRITGRTTLNSPLHSFEPKIFISTIHITYRQSAKAFARKKAVYYDWTKTKSKSCNADAFNRTKKRASKNFN